MDHRTTRFRSLALLAIALGGCPNNDSPNDGGLDSGLPNGFPDAGLLCNPATSTLGVGDTEQLSVEGDAGTTAFTWSSTAPQVASVDANGRVIATGVGTASIVAQTNSDYAVCTVNVGTCPGIDSIQGWTATLSVDFSASASGSTTFSLTHHVSVSVTLTRDTSSTSGVRFTGAPTGTGTLNESESISGGSTATQTGNGPVYSVGDLALTVDAATCMFKFEWLWAIDTTYAVNGSGTPIPMVNIASVTSASEPFTPSGLSSDQTVAYLPSGIAPGIDGGYVLLTSIGQAFAYSNPIDSGKSAHVTFSATPVP